MTLRRKLTAALGASILALPAMAAAQPYYGQPYDRGYRSGDERPRGDFSRGRQAGFGVYPEFRDVEVHIRSEIQDGVREDLIEPDDARDLTAQLRDIQGQEMREFRVHVDQIRDEGKPSNQAPTRPVRRELRPVETRSRPTGRATKNT